MAHSLPGNRGDHVVFGWGRLEGAVTDKWKLRLENLCVIAFALGLALLTVLLVMVGMDWVDGL